MPRPHLNHGKDPVPILQEAGWASGPVWKGAENLAPLGSDPRTVHSVGRRHTDYATRPSYTQCYRYNKNKRKLIPFVNVYKMKA